MGSTLLVACCRCSVMIAAIQKVKDKYDNKLVENIHVLCKDERLVIPKKLQADRGFAAQGFNSC